MLNTIFGPLQQLGKVILNYREAEASLQAFDKLLAAPIEQRPEDPVDVGEIESLRFEDVVFRYRDAAENAIDHVSFEPRLGDTIAFVGPSGSGKSTLVKLLIGLSTIAHADTIYVLERGRVVETGSHDALVEARGLYYAMWRQQIGEREPEAPRLRPLRP